MAARRRAYKGLLEHEPMTAREAEENPLMDPYTLLPEQVRARIRLDLSPERRLWLAVLTSAVDDLQVEYHRRSALAFLLSRETHIGSAQFCCEVLGITGTGMRERVRRLAIANGWLLQAA